MSGGQRDSVPPGDVDAMTQEIADLRRELQDARVLLAAVVLGQQGGRLMVPDLSLQLANPDCLMRRDIPGPCGGVDLRYKPGAPEDAHTGGCPGITFEGVDRNGAARGGTSSTRNVSAFVETRYRQGWRALSVSRAGVEVAGIGPHPDTGVRTWWSEASETASLASSRTPGEPAPAGERASPGRDEFGSKDEVITRAVTLIALLDERALSRRTFSARVKVPVVLLRGLAEAIEEMSPGIVERARVVLHDLRSGRT